MREYSKRAFLKLEKENGGGKLRRYAVRKKTFAFLLMRFTASRLFRQNRLKAILKFLLRLSDTPPFPFHAYRFNVVAS